MLPYRYVSITASSLKDSQGFATMASWAHMKPDPRFTLLFIVHLESSHVLLLLTDVPLMHGSGHEWNRVVDIKQYCEKNIWGPYKWRFLGDKAIVAMKGDSEKRRFGLYIKKQ